MNKNKWISLIMLAALVFCMLAGCGKDDKVPTGTIESGVDYDVIVIGGDPEGVCAAVSSARNGLKTLLIEDDAALGGLMTLGKLNFIDICASIIKEAGFKAINFEEESFELGEILAGITLSKLKTITKIGQCHWSAVKPLYVQTPPILG